MIQTSLPRWESKRTDETRLVEEFLRSGGFDQVDAYRYNPASIRVRVIDRRFERLSFPKRVDLVEPHLDHLPERTQADIIELFAFTPTELEHPKGLAEHMRYVVKNAEFEDPSPSMVVRIVTVGRIDSSHRRRAARAEGPGRARGFWTRAWSICREALMISRTKYRK